MKFGRPRYADILTPREWQVLELIEQGLTNEEIARRLDISFGTAKYHVGEIISKTGAASREDAVRIVRQRRGRFIALPWPRRRSGTESEASAGPPRLAFGPLAGGVAAVVLLIAVLFGGWLRDAPSSPPAGAGDAAQALRDFQLGGSEHEGALAYAPPRELRSYYFEARIRVDTEEEGFDDLLDTVRGWYQEPDRWRWEFSSSEPARAHETTIQVADGDQVWFHEGRTNTYSVQTIERFFAELPGEFRQGPPNLLATSVLIGPLAAPESWLNAFGSGWREQGTETVAGHTARVVELTTDNFTIRLWLHQEIPFVLRSRTLSAGMTNEGRGPSILIEAEVLDLRLDGPVDASVFVFQAPPGAREVEPPSSSAATSSGSAIGGNVAMDTPEGFLLVTYLPVGYSVTGSQTSSASHGVTGFDLRLQQDGVDDQFLVIEQRLRAGGLAESQRTGEPVSVGGREGYRQGINGEERLVWAAGDVVGTLRSNALPLEELLRVGESMR